MGGIFGVYKRPLPEQEKLEKLPEKNNAVSDLFFGVDYHSHLGTKSGGMAVYNGTGWTRSIHGIQNAQFRTKFEHAYERMRGNIGIGCISDTDRQPLLVRSKFGSFAITTVGRINNLSQLVDRLLKVEDGSLTDLENDEVSQTEVVAMLINDRSSISEGIRYAQQQIDGSMTILVANGKGIYCGRDLLGRTPLIIGQKEDGSLCAASESHAFMNLGYEVAMELGPGEVVFLGEKGIVQKKRPLEKNRICSFLWTYFGYPTATYEGINVEEARYAIGHLLAERDKDLKLDIDHVGGIPDSGLASAIGYSNASKIPFRRPFIKYTPTWPRSFMPANQQARDQIAHMKLIPIHELIRGKKLLFIDDSIVRGTQLRDAADLLFHHGAEEVHIRTACPPIMFGCKYINFSRSTSEMDLIARRVIVKLENGVPDENRLRLYLDETTEEYAAMVEEIRKQMHFTSLRYPTTAMLEEAIGRDRDHLCTYCFSGEE